MEVTICLEYYISSFLRTGEVIQILYKLITSVPHARRPYHADFLRSGIYLHMSRVEKRAENSFSVISCALYPLLFLESRRFLGQVTHFFIQLIPIDNVSDNELS